MVLSRGFLQNMFPVFLDSVFETRDVHRSTYTAQVNHRPRPWFSQRVNAGLDLTHTSNRHLTLPHAAGSNSAQGEKRDRTNRTEMRYVDYSATVTLDASPALNFATSGGLQYNEREFREIDARGREFPASGITTVEGARRRTIGDRFIENKTVGAYVQEQLSWQNRFFLTGAVRADDNSAFGKDFDFVTYPKLSSSWVVSEESFMAGTSSWLNQLRLRGAWGKAGQQPDVFAAVQTFTALPEGGLTPQNIGNPELKPETGSEVEMGFDASLWSNRLGWNSPTSHSAGAMRSSRYRFLRPRASPARSSETLARSKTAESSWDCRHRICIRAAMSTSTYLSHSPPTTTRSSRWEGLRPSGSGVL